jgi:hypothetical protein
MVLEIRTYETKPGSRDELARVFQAEALPMLRRWKHDVVYFGPSLHDAASYVLMRAYDSVEARNRDQDAFYGSDEWHKGPRAAVLGCIATMISVVLELPDAAIAALRQH